MSFDAMAPYRNKVTTHIWAVSKSGLVPVRKYSVYKETPKTFVLEDGTVVRKETMENTYQLFFTDEYSADVVYRNLSKVFDPFAPECDSNFDVITNATIDTLPNILITVIHELCEDGMPSAECVKEWLLSKPDKGQNAAVRDCSEQEDYSNLKDGDTIYYVDIEDNKVVQGVAFGVRRTNLDHSVRYISLIVPNDFMGCAGELLGDKIFLNKDLAENALKRGRKDV